MEHSHKIIFPRAFAFAIDDLGWNEGSDLSACIPSGPHRAGVKRTFDINDYRHIVTVGKTVGARIQSLFILSEMDRQNILANHPTTTYQGSQWNNSEKVNDHQIEIMNYVIAESASMEFGLHGTGHEYWAGDGIQRRAEWYNLKDRRPWPEESVREHITAFKEIMAQYYISKAQGHSFPESFVPCAYSYYWNPAGSYSLGKLLTEAGVKYANTDFSQIPELNPPKEINGGGFDFGTHVINRINYGNPWYKLDCLPSVALDQQETDIIESHWPNWLAQDDVLQKEVTERWINYYLAAQASPSRYIAKNSEQLHSQWLYKKYTKILEAKHGIIEIDNTAMPREAYNHALLGNLVFKIKLNKGAHVASALIKTGFIPSYFEQAGFGFFYLPMLQREKYTLTYTVGETILPFHVWNDGTYNVYHLQKNDGGISIELKMYGSQVVKIKCPKPTTVKSKSSGIIIEDFKYEDSSGYLKISVRGRDMQGERGILVIN